MGSLSTWHWVIVAVVFFLILWPLGRIIKRTGRHPAIALLGIIPLVNVALLWWLAYSRWPSEKQ
jgi:hypothetical protein